MYFFDRSAEVHRELLQFFPDTPVLLADMAGVVRNVFNESSHQPAYVACSCANWGCHGVGAPHMCVFVCVAVVVAVAAGMGLLARQTRSRPLSAAFAPSTMKRRMSAVGGSVRHIIGRGGGEAAPQAPHGKAAQEGAVEAAQRRQSDWASSFQVSGLSARA